MKKRKRKRSQFRRDLPIVLAFFLVVVLIVGAAWLAGVAHERNKHAEFFKMFNLPANLSSNIEDYAYWNDCLKYTDGYEVMTVYIDPTEWVTPEDWKRESVNPIEVFEPHDVLINPALKKLEGYTLLAEYPEWFFCEENPDGLSSEHSIYAGFYDQAGTLLLYRAHNLTSN